MQHFSYVETPQQNSVVERRNQHLLNVTRAIYFHLRVPLIYKSECVLTTTFFINRTPTPLLKINAYEILFNKVVDYGHLKVFGYLAFSLTIKVHGTKFEPLARKCIFLDYPLGIKDYQLLDL